MDHNDIRQKYVSSYLAFKNTPWFHALVISQGYKAIDPSIEWIPATAPQMMENGQLYFMCFYPSIEGGVTTVKVAVPYKPEMYENPNIIFSKVPILGMLNVGDCVTYLASNPVQHQSRGYCPSVTQIYTPNPLLMREAIIPTPTKTDSKTTIAVFNNKYIPYVQAVNALANGERVGCALGQFLGIVLELGRRHPLLIHRSEIIGRVNEDGMPCLKAKTSDAIVDYTRKITGVEVSFR